MITIEIDAIEINTSTGLVVADLSGRALSRKITKQRNVADVIELSFDLYNVRDYAKSIGCTIWDIFAVGKNEIIVKKGDVVLSAGQIVYAKIDNDGVSTVEVRAVGFFDLLGQRYTEVAVDFDAVDAGAIAWQLIDTSQSLLNGNFGILEGTIQTSINRDRSYPAYQNIKEAIVNLSEVINGFDFEITWDKRFNIYYPKVGRRRNDIVLTYPGNIREVSFERDATQISNRVIAIGSGSGDAALKAVSEDVTSQERFYVREKVLQYSDISELETLQQHADSDLTVNSVFMDVPALTLNGAVLPFGSYDIGDELQIMVEDNEILDPLNGWWRIDGIKLDLDENNSETVVLAVMR